MADAHARGAILKWLPDFLFRSDGSRLAYIGKAWLLALLPSIALSMLANALSPVLAPGQAGPDIAADTPTLFVLLVFVGPVLESIIMGGALLALMRWLSPAHAVVASAVLWGAAHSLASPIWGLVVWWPFLILSAVFLTWRGGGFWLGVAMATAVHGLQNATAGVALLAGLG